MSGTTVGQAIERKETGPSALVEKYGDDFATVLPSHIDRDTWLRLALGTMRKDPKLKQVAEQNPASLIHALMECARLGHEPGTKSFYLVPIGGAVEGWEGYRGVVDRMYRGGAVTSVKVELVREGDRFSYNPGTMDKPEHDVDWFGGDRGKILGVYSFAEMIGGATSRVVICDQTYLAKIRKQSRGSSSSSSPWSQWEEAMVLKTGAHRLEPWVPTSTEYRTREAAETHMQPLSVPLDTPALPAYDLPNDDEPVDAEIVDDYEGRPFGEDD